MLCDWCGYRIEDDSGVDIPEDNTQVHTHCREMMKRYTPESVRDLLRQERLDCANAMCGFCRRGYELSRLEDGRWFHQRTDDPKKSFVICIAGPIRELDRERRIK